MGCTSSTLDLQRKFEDHFELGPKISDGSFAKVFAVKRLGAAAKPAWAATSEEPSLSSDLGCFEDLVVKTVDLRGREPGSKGKTNERAVINNKRKMTLTKELAIREKLGKHEHCVYLHEVFVEQTSVYMVLERCPRTLLMELAEQPIRSEVDAGFWFRQMVAGIAHLHLSGIFHRGVCPKKFLLGVDGKVKLNDFSQAISLPKTATMALEEKSDIWALGVVFYELLYGSLPYPNGAEVSRECTRTPRFVRSSHCKTSLSEYPSMEQFVRTLLHQVPEKRPSAAEGFLALRHPESMAATLVSISSPGPPKLLLPVRAVLTKCPVDEEDDDEPASPARRRTPPAARRWWYDEDSDTESSIPSSQASTADLGGHEDDIDGEWDSHSENAGGSVLDGGLYSRPQSLPGTSV